MRSRKLSLPRSIWFAAFVASLVATGVAWGETPSDFKPNRLRMGVRPPTASPSEGAMPGSPTTAAQSDPAGDTSDAKAVPAEPSELPSDDSASPFASAPPPVPNQLPDSPTSPAPVSPAANGAANLMPEGVKEPLVAGGPSEAAEEPLKPIPASGEAEPIEIHSASFKSVTPGVSTLDDIQSQWGAPIEIGRYEGLILHLYRVEPFERVEVVLADDKVSSIVIRLDRPFPADLVTKQLNLTNLQPVLVSNEVGEILGQSFPERGVLFAFEPSDSAGKASMSVVQIILEPITAEPFLLRAETLLDTQPDLSLRDLDQAIKFAPENSRAYWLRARLLAARGEPDSALEAAEQAVGREPENPRYLLTQGQILASLGRFSDSKAAVEKSIRLSDDSPHVKARALCMLGDLYNSGPQPDYAKAIQFHTDAIKIADGLVEDRHPAVRLAAKEVMIDAHLGAAHDVAWGVWNQKEVSVPRWLDRASAFADDLISSDGGTAEYRLRVATRALAASVGMPKAFDPTKWAEEAVRVGEQLIATTPEAQKAKCRWDLGTALYDAVQVCQIRQENEAALKYGQQAVEYLESSMEARRASSTDRYLLGRLYFRMGAIYAVGKTDHRSAVAWFEKAIPRLDHSAAQVNSSETGRLGETFVSMGVSYWETGQRDRAVSLTQRGVQLIEDAVKSGTSEQSALEIPYGNLANMHRQLGKPDTAGEYVRRAARASSGTIQR